MIETRVGGLLVKYVFLTRAQKPGFFTADFTDFRDAGDSAKNEAGMKAGLAVPAGGLIKNGCISVFEHARLGRSPTETPTVAQGVFGRARLLPSH